MTEPLEGGEWPASRLGRTLLPGKDPVPILQEVGWAPGPVWRGGKSRSHRDSISDPPALSQSLYRLSYSAHSSDSIRNILSWNPQDSLSVRQYQYRVLGMQFLSTRRISFLYILILSCHLPLEHSIVILQSGFKVKILYTFSVSPFSARCPTHLIFPNSELQNIQ